MAQPKLPTSDGVFTDFERTQVLSWLGVRLLLWSRWPSTSSLSIPHVMCPFEPLPQLWALSRYAWVGEIQASAIKQLFGARGLGEAPKHVFVWQTYSSSQSFPREAWFSLSCYIFIKVTKVYIYQSICTFLYKNTTVQCLPSPFQKIAYKLSTIFHQIQKQVPLNSPAQFVFFKKPQKTQHTFFDKQFFMSATGSVRIVVKRQERTHKFTAFTCNKIQ